MTEIPTLAGQQELFPVQHQRSTIPRCGDCGRFLRSGCPCMNPRCYGDGAYSHIPAKALAAATIAVDCAAGSVADTAAAVLAAAWPHIIATINPPKGTP